jgi:hypothetical protein
MVQTEQRKPGICSVILRDADDGEREPQQMPDAHGPMAVEAGARLLLDAVLCWWLAQFSLFRTAARARLSGDRRISMAEATAVDEHWSERVLHRLRRTPGVTTSTEDELVAMIAPVLVEDADGIPGFSAEAGKVAQAAELAQESVHEHRLHARTMPVNVPPTLNHHRP